MKYFRTKDGIYEVDVLSIHYIGETHFSCWDIKHTRPFNEWHILKQADTIEELCDKFVMLDTNFGNIVVPDMEAIRFNLSKRGYVHHCSEIYGAIWTDKGLIYVAKMNEKGELELL